MRTMNQKIRKSFSQQYAGSLMATSALAVAISLNSVAAADTDQLSDSRIITAIEGEMFSARGVSPNNIDVTIQDGIVTLRGEVANILAADRSVRIAQMVKGVRSVVNQLSVRETSISDNRLQKDLANAIATDPATDSWEIDADVRDGMVTLSGAVSSYLERQLATTVAKSVHGVRGVTNNLAVNEVSRPDYEIENELTERLRWDVRLDDDLVDVSVEDGVVTLTGSVGSAYERSLAIGMAWTSGVDDVKSSELEVNWSMQDDMERKVAWTDLRDGDIEEAIRKAFLYDPRVYSFNPTISVDHGVATLTGMVNSLKAKNAAAQTARNTVGVWNVRNMLKVRPESEMTDSNLETSVTSALERDPFVERHDIVVDVIDGEAYLYGTVDTFFERSQAEDVVTRVNGVTDVQNHLNVDYAVSQFAYPEYYDWDPTLYDYDFDVETLRRRTDRQIRSDIESQLFWSPFVDEDEVTVKVDDGVATLTGTVDGWSEHGAAAENAIEGGAYKVINKLDVRYQ